jgi:hypothetical protein
MWVRKFAGFNNLQYVLRRLVLLGNERQGMVRRFESLYKQVLYAYGSVLVSSFIISL